MEDCKKMAEEKLLEKCITCLTGSCCKDGVEVDLKEAQKISQLAIDLSKPWFEGLCEDRDMPSGWATSTVVREGRCVFQRSDYRCMIYEHRPMYCREFPLENGRVAELYDYLCEKSASLNLTPKDISI
jgi:Fe-S-cluster containining protein